MTGKTTGHAGLVLAVLSALAFMLVGATAPAAALSTENVTLPTNETVDVTNDTEALRVVAENTTGDLTVNVTGINADGNETQVTTATLNTSNQPDTTTDTFEFWDVNTSAYDSYRIDVTAGETNATAEYLEITMLAATGGGGGLLDGADSNTAGAAAVGLVVLAGGGLVVLGRR